MQIKVCPHRSGKWVGKSVRREEDARYLTDRDLFVEDIERQEMLYAAFIRSSFGAHKGVSMGVPAAIASAVADALWHLNIEIDRLITPDRLRVAIKESRAYRGTAS